MLFSKVPFFNKFGPKTHCVYHFELTKNENVKSVKNKICQINIVSKIKTNFKNIE